MHLYREVLISGRENSSLALMIHSWHHELTYGTQDLAREHRVYSGTHESLFETHYSTVRLRTHLKLI